jgi:hypothetical protein
MIAKTAGIARHMQFAPVLDFGNYPILAIVGILF